MVRFLKRIGKAIAGGVTAILSLPVVNTILSDVPLEFTFEHVIGGAVVGAVVYLVPNDKDSPAGKR